MREILLSCVFTIAAALSTVDNGFVCNHTHLPIFCDASQPNAVRIADLLSKMSPDQKISQVGSNGVPALDPPLSIPAFQWWGEALHGVCNSPSVKFQPPTPVGTSFPEIIGVGGTFDKDLWAKMGAAVGLEARVMMNYGNAGGTFWAPNINLVKDPRWGRMQETPGEDPRVTTEYAYQFISNMQGHKTDRYLQASSCAKHYAGYSEENWHGDDRYHFNAVMSKRDWADYYSLPFEAAVTKANVSGLMCSYNAVTLEGAPELANNTPTCASDWLLTDLARDQWGFYGYITGDCGAAKDVYSTHNFTKTPEEAAALEIKNGMDVDCGSFVKSSLGSALAKGLISEEDIDKALSHLFSIRMRLGFFDPPDVNPYAKLTVDDVNMTQHEELSLLAAQESLVLLKNNNGALPTDKSSVHTIAVIGPNSDNGKVMQGVDCHGDPPFLITPVDALKSFGSVTSVQGCGMSSTSKAGFANAIDAAKSSDLTVLVMGLDPSTEYEMRDRTSLYLPGVQEELVEEVCAAAATNGRACVLVIISGGAIDTTRMVTNTNVSAIVYAGYPGQSGGTAIAKLIFGEAEPTGRLSQTWYTEDYIANMSMWDMGLRPNAASTVTQGRTHRFFTGVPLYPFGHGLQYTTFELQAKSEPGLLSLADVTRGISATRKFLAPPLLSVVCTVKNRGKRTSSTSVLAYLIPPAAGKDGHPLQNLGDFARTGEVAPGASTTVSFNFTAFDFALADADGRWAPTPGIWKVRFGNGGPESSITVTNTFKAIV